MEAAVEYPAPGGGAPKTTAGALDAARAAAARMGNNQVRLRLGALGKTITVGSETYEVSPLWMAVNAAAMGALAYHGYQRHGGSWGWAVVWGALGGLVWPITGAVAVAQGYGEPRGRG